MSGREMKLEPHGDGLYSKPINNTKTTWFNFVNWLKKFPSVVNQPQILKEYFSGIDKGDFYEEPIQGEYPDW